MRTASSEILLGFTKYFRKNINSISLAINPNQGKGFQNLLELFQKLEFGMYAHIHTYAVSENVPLLLRPLNFADISFFDAKTQQFLAKIVPLLKTVAWELR